MHGNRRNRALNLNAQLPSMRVPLQQNQTQTQAQPLPTPQLTTASAMTMNGARPAAIRSPTDMVVQYTNSTHNGVCYQSRQFPTHIPSLTHTQPPPQIQINQAHISSSSSPTFQRPTAVGDFTPDKLVSLFKAQRESMTADLKKYQEKLEGDIKEIQNSLHEHFDKLAEAMGVAHTRQRAQIKGLDGRMERVENDIKASFDRSDPGSLLSRLENIQYSVGELSERSKDPDAMDIVMIAGEPNDIANEIHAPTGKKYPLMPPTHQPTYKEQSTSCENLEQSSIIQPVYKEQSTSCENLEQPPVIPVRPVFVDAGNDAMTLEPECSLQSRSTTTDDLIQPKYTSIGNDPRTPSHPRLLQRITTTGSSNSLRTPSRMAVIEFPSFDSGTSPLAKGFHNETKAPVHSDDLIVSPRLKRKQQVRTAPSPGIADVGMPPAIRNPADNEELPILYPEELNDMPVDEAPDDIHMNEPEDVSPIRAHGSSSQSREGSYMSSRQGRRSPSASHLLPSPATTPSALHSPQSLELQSSSSPVIPVTTPRRPIRKTTLIASSPSSGSNEEQSAPLQDLLNEASTSRPTLSSPSTQSPEVPYRVPGSENDSEDYVSRLIADPASTELPLEPNISDPLPSTTVKRPTPLFLPDSRPLSPSDDLPDPSLPGPSPPPSHSPKTSCSPSKRANPKTPFKTSSPSDTTIFSPGNLLRRRGAGSASVKPSPAKSQQNSRRSTRAAPPPPPPEPAVVNYSPIYVSSRSPSPLSDLSESDADSDSALVRIVRKKTNRETHIKRDSVASSTSASTNVQRRVDLSQKVKAKTRESAAITRVKKRKAPSAAEMEPPLKRARQKVDEGDAVRVKRERKSVGAPPSSKGKEKDDQDYRIKDKVMSGSSSKGEKKLRPRAPAPTPPPGCKWPKKNESGDKKFDRQFIECEKCYTWYHYGCVGISDLQDPIAKNEVSFVCPPCSGGGANPLVPSKNLVCGRPDCGQEAAPSDEYFMTSIIGRHTKVQSGTGRRYMWLVKWDGYSVKECTWEEETNISEPLHFIEEFISRAKKEGKDAEADPHSTFLLREAISAGWKDPNA